MKFAAIDVGSNAVRLLFTQVFENKDETYFKKDSLFRVPIRLGEDVFVKRKVSDEKADSLVKTMIAFKYLIEAYGPLDYMAIATAAMREAENSGEIVNAIKSESGIDLEIIDGKREAEIIYSNHVAEKLGKKGNYLYIDVGGGSTELTLISGAAIVNSHSFKLGTVRLLTEKVPKTEWQRMKDWLKESTSEYPSLKGIGTGGNINKILKMSLKEEGDSLTYKNIKKVYDQVNSYSFEDRISKLNLRPDRADVIIPATKIFLKVIKWTDIQELYVPSIGLSDGIIHVLYERQKEMRLKA
ncbi:MAG: exopolyphosphatase [Deltaproteobacteria bacterium]|nr:exopolyphosphatase [Deltaproteobacteria bacterium]MCK5709976.1 exopolyphosphatase [Deltaproteobacteria bacterium]